jgi:predicted peptidase
MKSVVIAAILLAAPYALAADPPVGQHPAKLDSQIKVSLDYLLYLPEDYAAGEQWPLLLFLHGAGERGTDLELVTVHGPPKLIAKQGKKFPCIVVSPQCPLERWWEPLELVALIDELCGKYKVDRDRIYCTGLSMGGFGTWALAARIPDRLAAIAPICGGGEAYWAKMYKDLPIWAFHGAKDEGVPPARSEQMVEAVKKAGGNARLTVYPEAEHDSWTQTYENPEFYEWLFAQKRG